MSVNDHKNELVFRKKWMNKNRFIAGGVPFPDMRVIYEEITGKDNGTDDKITIA